jgi:P-type E1-E2 ATPase
MKSGWVSFTPFGLRATPALCLQVIAPSGDSAARAQAMASLLDIPTSAALSPNAKVSCVESLGQQVDPIAMVDDGLNDAPALATADVGIAMGCGADLSRDAADVCLLGNNLETVAFTLRLARRTVTTIKRNLFWAVGYNILGIGVALSGHLSPIVAALAMGLSSLFVGNSLRLRSF